MHVLAPSPKGGSGSLPRSPLCPFLGWEAEAGSWKVDGTEPDLPRASRSQPVAHKPLTKMVKRGGRKEMDSCLLQVLGGRWGGKLEGCA